MEKFKYISLDLNSETRNDLMQRLPNLHCFQNSIRCNDNSGVHLYGSVLLRDIHLKHDDKKELATALAEKYLTYVKEGKTNFKLRLTHIGWEDYVMAFKCEGDLAGIEPDKQLLVISTYNYHSPKEAYSINHWIELKPIELDVELKIHKS